MNVDINISNHIIKFTELIHTPVIISDYSNYSEIIHINNPGKELIKEIFSSVDEFIKQVSTFSGFFKKIITQNSLQTIYTDAIAVKKNINDLFVSFTDNKNILHSLLLNVSLFTDDISGESYVITSINNITDIFQCRSELHFSTKFLEGFIEAFSQDRMVYLLAYEHEETVKHLMEVREFSKLIAGRIMNDYTIPDKHNLEYSKITPLYIRILEISALLHDFGKIHDDIHPLIQLPRKLTSEEFETVKKHTTFGAELIGTENVILRMCWLVAKYHHEKWDGSGYPEGLKGSAIPLSARIVAFADMFSALRDKRTYKRAITDRKELMDIFYQCESQFDPVVFSAGMELIPEMLEMTTGIKSRYRDLKEKSGSFIRFFR